MAAIATVQRNSVAVKLNDGTHGGTIKTVNSGFPPLNLSAYNDEKVLNIVDDLEPCLTKEVVQVEHTQVSRISRS